MANIQSEEGQAHLRRVLPGLAGKSEEEVKAAIAECSNAVRASRSMPVVYAYSVIGGVAFFILAGAWAVTKHPSFLVLLGLAGAFTFLRIRAVWQKELRAQLHERYGVSSQRSQ